MPPLRFALVRQGSKVAAVGRTLAANAPLLGEFVLGLATLPLLLLAWAKLAFARWPFGIGVGVEPWLAIEVVFLLVPVIAFWVRIAPRGSRYLRPAALVGTVASLCAARPEALLGGLEPEVAALVVAGSPLLLGPAALEWSRYLPGSARSSWLKGLAGPARDAAVAGIVAVVMPLAFLLVGPVQRFPPPGWVDPAMYVGLALELPHHLRSFGWNYHALRVSYVLPSHLLTTLLPPVPARLALVILFHLLGTISLYAGTRVLWGRAPAAIAVTLLACNPVFLLAATAGYVDGAFVGYLLLLFAALTVWWRGGTDAPLVAAGAATTLAFLAHPMAAAPAGIILLSFAVLGWERVTARPLRTIGAGLFGAACAWLFFVLALSTFGFGLSAFEVLRRTVQASAEGIGAHYRAPLGEWLPRATRLVPGLLILLTLGAVALRRSAAEDRRKVTALLLLTVLTVALLPVYDVVLRGSLTQSAFYAGLSLPGIAIASGAIAAFLLPIEGGVRARMTVGAVLLIYLLAWFAPSLWYRVPGIAHVGILAAAAVGSALLVLVPPRAAAWARVAPLPLFVGIFALAMLVNADTRVAFRLRGEVSNIEFFRASVFTNAALRDLEREQRFPLFWFDRTAFTMRDGRSREFLRPLRYRDTILPLSFYDSLASLRLWDVFLFSPVLRPGMEVDRERLLSTSVWTLAVLGQGPETLETARSLLGTNGIACRVRRVAVYESRTFVLFVSFLDVLGAREDPSAYCDDPETPAATAPPAVPD